MIMMFILIYVSCLFLIYILFWNQDLQLVFFSRTIEIFFHVWIISIHEWNKFTTFRRSWKLRAEGQRDIRALPKNTMNFFIVFVKHYYFFHSVCKHYEFFHSVGQTLLFFSECLKTLWIFLISRTLREFFWNPQACHPNGQTKKKSTNKSCSNKQK